MPASLPKGVTSEDIEIVFDRWVELTWNGKGVRPRMADARRRKIIRALRDYGLIYVLQAIEGVTHSTWHMGDNPGGKRYTDITLILRDETKIEWFANLTEQANSTGTERDELRAALK